MNATRMKLKKAGTGIIKTYGKCNVRKVEIRTWLSPNSKEKFFSSATSFEASANSVDSCDSDFLPSKRLRKNVAAPSKILRPLNKRRKTPVKKKIANHTDFEKCCRVLRERNKSKENIMQKCQYFAPVGEEKENDEDAFQSTEPSPLTSLKTLGKFVTERKKHNPLPGSVAVNRIRATRKNKKTLLATDTLGSSSDFLTSPAHVGNLRKKNTKRRHTGFSANLSSQLAYTHLKTRRQNYKRPLLCSTPSMAQKYSCITKDPSISEISCTDLEDSLCRKVESSDINEILHQNQMHLNHEKTPATQPCQVEGCKDLSLPAECKSISLPSKRTLHLKRSISAPLNAETKNECVLGSIASSTRDEEAKQTSLRSVKCISSSCSRNEIVVGTEMSGSRELFSESVICLGSPASPPGVKCIAVPTTPLTADIESSFHELERKRAELVHLCTSVKAVINLSPLNVHKALHNGPVMQNSSCKGKSGTLLEPVSAKECLDVDRSLHVLNYVTSETERKIAELKQLCSTVQPFVLLEAMALDASTADNNRTEITPFVSDTQHERSRIRTRKIRRDSKKLCTKLFLNYDESSGEIKDCKADMCIKPQDEEIHVSNNSVELYCPQPPEPLCPTDVVCGIPEKKTEFKEDNRKSDEHLNHYFGDKRAPHSIQSKVLKPKVTSALKEGAATARKACISGFSSSRWGKRAKTKDFSKKNPLARSKKDPDFSFSDFRHHKENKRQVFEGISRGGVLGIFTPGAMQKAGLHDSFFCSPSPSNCPLEFSQLLSSRGWSRLKASLSVHNKKKVVPTPSRLKRLELRDVHKSGLITPQRGTPGFLHRQDMYAGTPCDDLIGPSPSHELSFMGALTPLGSPSYIEDISDAEKVFRECQQDGPISFEECIPPKKLKQCVKIGEGVFGEVFRSVNDKNESVALKIIPIEGQDIVNGESQKTFDSILPEIIISKELSCLTDEKINRTDGFVTLHSVHCVKGSYPSHLLKAWDKFDKERGSENDRPDFFGEEQLFIVLEFEFGGSDLEHMKNKLSSAATLLSILHQVTASLAVAEEALKFEHRDLHWGNVLVKTTDLKEVKYTLNGTEYTIMTRGVQTNIIDYTLSRLEKDGLTVFCDMSADEDLFKGEGDYQFDIYRKMREENLNSWIEYNPHSNVLWLHYLADKMLNEMVLKRKLRTAPMKAIWKKIKEFHSEVRTFSSAVDVLQCSKLFQ